MGGFWGNDLFLDLVVLILFYLKDFIYLFLERGEGREKERGKSINVRGHLLYAPQLGTELTTWACALTGN